VPTIVYLGLGSNIGDREATLNTAVAELSKAGAKVVRESSKIETDPVGFLDQPAFLNMAVEVETTKSPRELLAAILTIERQLGRVRTIRNGPRTIDIDILLFGSVLVEEPDLTIPHPRMTERGFVLQPLAELCPDLIHPVTGLSIREHLRKLDTKPS
jgi:2-amino-4-hydroxy-6-hydroxymethyldihydropteridine diphosphokinase